MADRIDFFEDIALAMETWVESATDALTNPAADLKWTDDQSQYKELPQHLASADRSVVRAALTECLRGFAVSMLTALDGGTALAEKGRLYLVDETGQRLGEGLHSEFVGYLMDTDRLK
jgi:hypothetical protein